MAVEGKRQTIPSVQSCLLLLNAASGNFFFFVFHGAGTPAPGPHHVHAMTAASVNFQLFWQALSAKSCKITPPSTARNRTPCERSPSLSVRRKFVKPSHLQVQTLQIYKCFLLCQIQSGKFPSLDNNKEKFSAFVDPPYTTELTLSSSELLVSQLESGNRERRYFGKKKVPNGKKI